MDKLTSINSKAIVVYISFPCFAIILAIICAIVFHFLIPFWLLGTIALLGPLVSAFMRFQFWKKRHMLLPSDVLNSRQARIVFAAIPAEIIFWIIGMGFLLLES